MSRRTKISESLDELRNGLKELARNAADDMPDAFRANIADALIAPERARRQIARKDTPS